MLTWLLSIYCHFIKRREILLFVRFISCHSKLGQCSQMPQKFSIFLNAIIKNNNILFNIEKHEGILGDLQWFSFKLVQHFH